MGIVSSAVAASFAKRICAQSRFCLADVRLREGRRDHGKGSSGGYFSLTYRGPSGTDFTDFVGTASKSYGNTTPGGSVGYGLDISPVTENCPQVAICVSAVWVQAQQVRLDLLGAVKRSE